MNFYSKLYVLDHSEAIDICISISKRIKRTSESFKLRYFGTPSLRTRKKERKKYEPLNLRRDSDHRGPTIKNNCVRHPLYASYIYFCVLDISLIFEEYKYGEGVGHYPKHAHCAQTHTLGKT